MNKSEDHKCPNCGKPMTLGKLSANGMWYGYGVLTWVEERKREERLESMWWPRGLRAFRCKECGILICYENPHPPPRETPKSFLKKCHACGSQIPIASEYCPKCGVEQKKTEE